ncbi:MAG: OB-fold nucleic acid binding domain-containing protein, partial [Acidimicrobiia bacterium]|nr:OB-fold nucleic acid binding domain-containing protein [Acidimicrobiia bacterium]
MVEEPKVIRTHHAGAITESHVAETLTVAGWVQRRRDHGGIVFVDVRDASGLIQVVADPSKVSIADELRMEFCVSVTGQVQRRPEGTVNPDLETGTVEIKATAIVVLSPAETLP